MIKTKLAALLLVLITMMKPAWAVDSVVHISDNEVYNMKKTFSAVAGSDTRVKPGKSMISTNTNRSIV